MQRDSVNIAGGKPVCVGRRAAARAGTGMTDNRPAARTRYSKILTEIRRDPQARTPNPSPQRRREIVFQMIMDNLRLHRAGLKAQGLAETDVREGRKARSG